MSKELPKDSRSFFTDVNIALELRGKTVPGAYKAKHTGFICSAYEIRLSDAELEVIITDMSRFMMRRAEEIIKSRT